MTKRVYETSLLEVCGDAYLASTCSHQDPKVLKQFGFCGALWHVGSEKWKRCRMTNCGNENILRTEAMIDCHW